MKSPFKFLDAYTAKDKDVFFGREKEIDALYNMVFKTPLVMVYGLSGTGKSSLVQCGLATKFDGPDWLPILIRKGDDINVSLRTALTKALNEEESSEDLNVLIERLFYKYFRPVYLLFDQFEELFTLEDDNQKEQIKFMEDIERLQKAELPCRIILIIREEYIGQLYDFEKIIPTIFDYKLRVEPMSDKYIRQVMLESFNAFNITLEPPEEDRLEQIMSKLRIGKTDIPLPYLQVYLDRLYKKDYQDHYPNGTTEQLPPLTFTAQEIHDFGKFDDVLQRFLKEQKKEIQAELYQQDKTIPKDAVKSILDVFVTDEGTKRPIHYTRQNDDISIVEKIREDELANISNQILSNGIRKLEESKILRFRDNTIELAHDTLAALINGLRTDEQRKLSEIRREIKSTYTIHQKLIVDKKEGSFLSRGQLEWYKPVLLKLKLTDSHHKFIVDSDLHHKAVQEAENAKRRAELTKERTLRGKAEESKKHAEAAQVIAEKNAKRARQRTRLAMAVSVLALITAGMALWSWTVADEAKTNAQLSLIKVKEADIKRFENQIKIAQSNKQSFRHFQADNDVIEVEEKKIKKYSKLKNTLIIEKDSLQQLITN